MIENAIVLAAIVFSALFVVLWAVRADLRAWIEKPKYSFQQNVQSYDQTRMRRPIGNDRGEGHPK